MSDPAPDPVPEPMSEADKIRNKRIAKLSQPESHSKSQADSPTDNLTTPEESPPQGSQSRTTLNSASKSTSTPTQMVTNASRIRVTSSTSGNITPQKREVNGQDRPSARSGENIDQFEDRTLRNIFRVTLQPGQTADVNGHKLYYLPGLSEEILADGKEVRLTVDILEQAIMEAGSNLGKVTPHDYLLACWKRVSRLSKAVKDKSSENQKWTVISEARRLCMSWCIFSITTPEIFGQEYSGSTALAEHLLVDPEDDRGVCHDFLGEFIARFDEDELLKSVFVEAVEELSRQLAKKSMDSDFRSYSAVMRNLVRYKPLATAITESPNFCDTSVPAAQLEVQTLLGPYFQISPLQAEVTKQYFGSPKTMDEGRIRNAQQTVQMTLRAHQAELFDIVNQLVRASTEARERVLDWFALVLNANHKRRAIQVDKATVSSDGFMININTCLSQLFEPVMDATFSRIARVEIDYLRRNPRVDIKDETKLNADQAASDSFYETAIEGTNNFVSEIFFLTIAAHHYGSDAVRTMLADMEKELNHMAKQMEQFETERHKYVSNPALLTRYEAALKKYQEEYDRGLSYKHAVKGVLLDEQSQARSMQIMRFLTVWILRQVSQNGKYPQEKLTLPLNSTEADNIKCLPEYFINVISGNFGYVLENLPQIITSTQSDELIMLCIAFLRNSEYIKNPYLAGSLIKVLFRGTWPYRQGDPGILANQYNSLPFATEYLLHSLMKFFIEAEFMGGHGQFFDKFNVRFEIFQIIKCIWPNRVYRDKLAREAKLNSEFFVRFVNLLLNDVTFVLDESFSAFHKIYRLQNELSTAGNGMNEEERKQKEGALESEKRSAKSYMQLTNETVAMVKLFTEALADSFTMPEIVQRLADMLDYNLDAMVPPKSASLKVDNLHEYSFRPRELLSEIIDVYLNLMNKPNFILAVARDGRSYKPANFDSASVVLTKFNLKTPDEIAKWEKLKVKFAAAKAEDDAADADLGDVPEEYLDPLMFTLMEDPVILPTSRTIVDRSTIRSHLLSDPNDPFNRQPLKIEDVKPATEMKEKIEKFKQDKIGGRKKDFVETVRTDEVEPMDTT